MSFIVTPFVIIITLINDSDKIKERKNLIYNQRYGSLFHEFKNDNILSYTAYYPILTLRSLIYSINQMYLSKYELSQKLINFLTSLIFFIYLLKFRPFRETGVMVTEMVAEFSIMFLFLIIIVIGYESEQLFNILFISCIMIQIGFQYFISIIMFLKSLNSNYIQYVRNKLIAKNTDK